MWIVLVYWLVTAAVLLNFGRLSDMFGRVKLYNMGFALFTFGSGLCSISQTGEQLVLFRIIQALGAAFLFSNSAAIITDTFQENERAKALGLNQMSIVVASGCGVDISTACFCCAGVIRFSNSAVMLGLCVLPIGGAGRVYS